MAMVEAEQSNAMTLRVHGGGGLAASLAATGETELPQGLEGLDTHVLDAACRARLTQEERLAREVTRRREMELERRQRIFDAKRRTIGVDKEALDAQVAEHERLRLEQKKNDAIGDRHTIALDRHMKVMEATKKQMKHDLEKECREFSKMNLAKEQADTFDLNDPRALRKSQPMRTGDTDPRCGPASMLKFGGEDLMKDERVRQQRLQQVMFIEQQKFEKEMINQDNGDAKIAKETADMIALRNEMEANESSLRRELQKNQQDANIYKAAEIAAQRQALIEEDAERDAAELDHHSKDPWLNETTDQLNPAGKIRRAEYKGSTRDERLQGRLILEHQAAERDAHKFGEKVDTLRFAQHQEATRRQLVLQEREKARSRRAIMEQNAKANLQLHAEKGVKTKALNELYTNRFSDEFFGQFGKETR